MRLLKRNTTIERKNVYVYDRAIKQLELEGVNLSWNWPEEGYLVGPYILLPSVQNIA